MDSTVKQILDGFRFSVSNYTSSLGPENAKLMRTSELVESLYAKAEDGSDMMAISMDPEFGEVAALIGELASEPALLPEEQASESTGGDSTPDGEIPPASIAAAGYHMAYDSMDPAAREKQGRYYTRIFELEEQAENALHFNTLMVEDGVLLEMSREPLIETAKETLAQAEEIHSPTVNHQQQLAMKTYAEVKSIAELEFQGTLMAELSNVEHEWDALFIEVIGLLPACAQAIEAFGPTDDNVAKLRNSHKFMPEFMGITWDGVFADPRYLLFWNEIFWPKVPAEKRKKYEVNSAEGWRDVLKEKFYDPYVKDEPVPRTDSTQTCVRLWRKEYSAHEALDLLNDPPRPLIKRD
ncbi:MAG: hypothetical protein K8S15_05750 [Candidatus Aegiribacteria sp.]|nr:hypothetical protein [Candidatus Aegiribacteria sp.]